MSGNGPPADKAVTNAGVELPAETHKIVPSGDKKPVNQEDMLNSLQDPKPEDKGQKVGSVDGVVDHGMTGKEVTK